MARDPDHKREYNRQYREKNREKVRAWHRAWAETHRDARNAAHKASRLARIDIIRERERITSFTRRKKVRDEALEHLGNRCVRCGFTDWRALQIDHVNGSGTKQHAHKKSFSWFYKEVIASVPGEIYQLLCANCNQIKRYEKGEGVGINSKFSRRRPK